MSPARRDRESYQERSVVGLGSMRRSVAAARDYLRPGAADSHLAAAALELYGLRNARSTLLARKEGKLLFRVEPRRGRSLLRIYEPAHWDEAALGRELTWLQALRRDTRLVVPEPMPANDGSLINDMSFEEQPFRCVLLSWQPGRHKVISLRPTDLAHAGSFVARLHRHSEEHALFEGFAGPHAWDWEWVFGEGVALWSKGGKVYSPDEMEVFRAAAERVRRDLRELGKGGDVFGMIHRDLIPENLVFHGGEAYAIDFENCGPGHYLFDLSTTLSTLEAHGARSAPMQRAFLDGYQRERDLPESHRGYLETFMAMRVARRVTKVLKWKTPTQQPWGPKCLSGSVEGLRTFVADDGGTGPMDFDSPWWRGSYSPGWRRSFGWRGKVLYYREYLPARRG